MITETKAELREKIKELEAKIEDLEYEADRQDEAYCDLERQLDTGLYDIDLKTLKEIIHQVEYKLTTWRKLDTAEDVVNAIRKEVLGE